MQSGFAGEETPRYESISRLVPNVHYVAAARVPTTRMSYLFLDHGAVKCST